VLSFPCHCFQNFYLSLLYCMLYFGVISFYTFFSCSVKILNLKCSPHTTCSGQVQKHSPRVGGTESGEGNLQTIATKFFLLEQFRMKKAYSYIGVGFFLCSLQHLRNSANFRHSEHMTLFLNHVFDRQILNTFSMTVC
jgi:hypothetical protein